jgi:uncharacterized protein YjbJ (UPF0337 family)
MTTSAPGEAYYPEAGSSSAGSQAQQTAGTAKEEGKHVAGVAKDEAGNVAQEAKAQARDLVGELKNQMSDQSRGQRDNLVQTLRQLGDELHQMAQSSSSSGVGAELARQAADRSHRVSSYLQDREPGDLVDEVRRFAARRPGAFLFGALAAGVVAGRLTRGVAAAHGVGTGEDDTTRTDVLPARGTTVIPPTEAPASTLPTGGVPTGPAVDPVEPGYGAVPVPEAPPTGVPPTTTQPGTTRPGGLAP